MGYAEKRGDYWRGRYKLGPRRYGTVTDFSEATIRFRTRREAERAANDAEAKARGGARRDLAAGRVTFGEYVSRWYAAQDLAASTMQNYRRHIEEHLLPAFEDMAVADVLASDITAWEKRERAAGYAESSIKTWRGTLHLILADAVEEGLRDSNPRQGDAAGGGVPGVLGIAARSAQLDERAGPGGRGLVASVARREAACPLGIPESPRFQGE